MDVAVGGIDGEAPLPVVGGDINVRIDGGHATQSQAVVDSVVFFDPDLVRRRRRDSPCCDPQAALAAGPACAATARHGEAGFDHGIVDSCSGWDHQLNAGGEKSNPPHEPGQFRLGQSPV